jgi:chromate transporter
LLAYFVKLGALGFGGPIALAGAMQRDLVDRQQWISLQEYKGGLALAQLAPGPLAAQLAIYLGWMRFRVLGATLVAFAFILPSLLMVLGLAALYVRFGGLSWMQGVFYGVGAAVIAIIARSAWKLAKALWDQNGSPGFSSSSLRRSRSGRNRRLRGSSLGQDLSRWPCERPLNVRD